MKCLMAGAIVLAGSHLAAAACDPSTSNDVPSFEIAKEAFLQADYEGFFQAMGPYFPGTEYEPTFGQVRVVFPNPYRHCRTVLQRREAPGFYQELVFYFPAGSDAPLALLLIGAEVDGQVNLIEFSFNTNISDVLDDLK